ncbi:YdcF family protein [Rhodocyclus tenuis]|uniref:YdcF family protein n=1 Tax=Rhodocyclus gracilis TaxID=2929842 RepID=A0ABX0WK83_9RHOO|nr:YdcF family protein [Rhodocyclus gracilis]NJA90009.1 YdcF family protein [Rhodocyclus gracilis]
MDGFVLKKLISAIILPPVGPLLLLALGLWQIGRRRPRPRLIGWWLAWGGVLSLFALSLPGVAVWLSGGLSPPSPTREEARRAQAIVVLGGGVRRRAEEFGGTDVLGESTLVRLRYGAYLHRQTGLPILVSGGAPEGGDAEAQVMARTLRDDYGLSARWIEDQSLDTRGNAERSAVLLAESGIARVLLVSERYHMRRASAEFERAGLTVIAAPTGAASDETGAFITRLPSAHAFHRSEQALKEWLGIAVMRLAQGAR